MKRLYAIALAAAVMGAAGGAALGDTLELKDGRTLSGTVTHSGNTMTVTGENGKSETVRADEVKSVLLVGNITPAQAADAEWTRVAVLVKRANDLQTIINLHQKFLEKFPDQPISADVKGSLTEYQLLATQNGVKFRGRWMPAGQVDVTIKEWAERAKPALALYQGGRIREALGAATDILSDDPVNPNALAVAGLASYRLNNLGKARDYFTQMAAADPSSVLAENNLAVVFAQQKRDGEAMIHYTRALQAMPGNRLVLDNIMEELAAFTGNVSLNSQAYTDLVRQFEQAEFRMEGLLNKQGLLRYGATWVTAEQMEKIKSMQHDIDTAMAQLEAQYQGQRLGGAQMDQTLQDVQKEYADTINAIAVLDAQIISARTRGGDIWYLLSRRDALAQTADQLKKQLVSLQAQHDQAVAGMSGFYSTADKLKAAQKLMDASKYSGIQRIMEVGDDENPPAPSVVVLPGNLPVIPQAQPAPGTIVIVHNNDDATANDTDVVQTGWPVYGTPFGWPGFPPRGNNGGNGGGHHGGDGNGNGNGNGPGSGHHGGGANGGNGGGNNGGNGWGGGHGGWGGGGGSSGGGSGGGGSHGGGGGTGGGSSGGGSSGGGMSGGGGGTSGGSSSGSSGSSGSSNSNSGGDKSGKN